MLQFFLLSCILLLFIWLVISLLYLILYLVINILFLRFKLILTSFLLCCSFFLFVFVFAFNFRLISSIGYRKQSLEIDSVCDRYDPEELGGGSPGRTVDDGTTFRGMLFSNAITDNHGGFLREPRIRGPSGICEGARGSPDSSCLYGT